MTKTQLLKIIKEEVEVILTNNEAIEFFDLAPSKLLDEMMKEGSREVMSMPAISPEEQAQAGKPDLRGREKRAQKQFDKSGMMQPLKLIRRELAKATTPAMKSEMILKVIFPALGLPTDPAEISALTAKLRQASRKDAAPKRSSVWEERLNEKDLSAAERRALPDSDFALPGKGEGPKGKQAGSYPIPDESHARSALSMVAKHGTSEEKAKVRAAVKRKFPDIKQGKD